MRLVYTNENPSLVGYARNLIEDAGIMVVVKNEFSQGGHAPPYNLWPELYVLSDADYARSRKVLDDAFKDKTGTGVEDNEAGEEEARNETDAGGGDGNGD